MTPPLLGHLYNHSYETERMARACLVRIAYEAEWHRQDSYYGGYRFRSRLRGPFGEMMRRAMQNRFSSGPTQITPENGDPFSVYGFRWQQLEETLEGVNLLEDIATKMSLLYRPPPGQPELDINGEIDTIPMRWLYKHANMGESLVRRQKWMIGRQCAAIRPTLRRFPGGSGELYPPGLTVLGAEQCWAIEDPVRDGVAAVFGEVTEAGNCLVWDVSDPRNPIWGEWANASQWARGAKSIWSMEGRDYPWRWAGEPLMPCVIVRWDPSARELLPASLKDVEAVKGFALKRMWLGMVEQASGFTKAIMTSSAPLSGLETTMLDPTVITNVWGKDAKVNELKHSLDAVKIAWELYEARLVEWTRQRFDQSFQVKREGGTAQSGYAISLQMTGQYLLRQQMEARARAADSAIVKALAATYNYENEVGALGLKVTSSGMSWAPGRRGPYSVDVLIPEVEPELRYPHMWRPEEQVERRSLLVDAINMGQEEPEALWLFDRSMENDGPDGPNWRAAEEALPRVAAKRLALASLGYGLGWAELATMAATSTANEAAEYIPPPDVASVASQGLEIRQDFKSRFGGRENTHLLQRAKALANSDPMLLGEVRRLNAWLDGHERDRDIDPSVGEWGSNANPSPEYLRWLSQGGDAALAWTNSILNQPADNAEKEGEQ